LLHGTGKELVDAVNTVLTAAGFTTVNLDEELGGTRSAGPLGDLRGGIADWSRSSPRVTFP
jgi:hypothetical protein